MVRLHRQEQSEAFGLWSPTSQPLLRVHGLPRAHSQIEKLSCPFNALGPRQLSEWGQSAGRDLIPPTHPSRQPIKSGNLIGNSLA